jgi:hypothetical protein
LTYRAAAASLSTAALPCPPQLVRRRRTWQTRCVNAGQSDRPGQSDLGHVIAGAIFALQKAPNTRKAPRPATSRCDGHQRLARRRGLHRRCCRGPTVLHHLPRAGDDGRRSVLYGKSELSTAPSQLCLAPGTRRLLDCVRPCTCRGSAGWAHARCVAVAAVHKPFTGAGSMFPGSRSLRCACRRCG